MTTGFPWRAMLPAIAFLFLGCSSDNNVAGVDGTVKLDGKPLKGALVKFTPQAGGRPSYGRTDDAGYYELAYTNDQEGAEIGKHSVSITTYEDTGGYEDEGKGSEEKVPAKYNSQTELVEEVPAGGATINFDLDSEGEIDTTGGYGGTQTD